MMRELFYKILRSGLWGGDSRTRGFSVSESERKVLYKMGYVQAVSGILAMGMDECGVDLGNDSIVWAKVLMYIERKGRKIEVLAQKIVKGLENEGLKAEVFKGPSVAKWYRNPLARSYGDIDVVVAEGNEKIEGLLSKWGVECKRLYEDVECSIEGVNVEFHQRRDFAYCPKDNRTLQQLVKDFPNSNEVYLACIMVHLRRHLLAYGMGMKQVCDVAVMLRNAELDMDFMAEIIRELHMERFCAALFGFLKRCLGVEVFPDTQDQYLGRDGCLMVSDGFVVFTDIRPTEGSTECFVMPPVSFPELNPGNGCYDVVSCSPAPTSDVMIREWRGLPDDGRLASILVGYNLSEKE